MYVIVAGGGRTGSQLARVLIQQDHEVRIIENRKEVLSDMHQELPTEVIVEGNPVFPEVLKEAGIEQADVLAACTSEDEINLIISYYAKNHFGVSRTISRVNNPRNAWLFNATFGIDVALNQADILARLIQEEMSLGDMMTLLKLRRGNYSLITEKIETNAPAVGKALKDLDIPEHCVISAVIRDGELMIPRGNTVLNESDEVLAIVSVEEAKDLAELLTDPARKLNHKSNGKMQVH